MNDVARDLLSRSFRLLQLAYFFPGLNPADGHEPRAQRDALLVEIAALFQPSATTTRSEP